MRADYLMSGRGAARACGAQRLPPVPRTLGGFLPELAERLAAAKPGTRNLILLKVVRRRIVYHPPHCDEFIL
ncbi:hypothetical protein JHW40_11400 [Paracoccus alcaliphilus]|nr:hypothetical protein JHW40_11400 [Paracoccus alcaliphilus]